MRSADVRGIAERALGWVHDHRSRFRLADDPLAPDADVDHTWKPLGELAQVCVCVRRRTDTGDPLHRTATELLDHAWRQTGHGSLFLDLLRLEPFATYPLECYAAFASEGLRHPGFEALASTVTRTRGWRMTEQQPNRRLGIANSERRSGLTPHQSADTLLRRTWLGGLPEPWTFERTAGYTLTHVVFHATDWGLRVRALPADVADYLEAWLPPWVDTCFEDDQWDLGCELLAVTASLPRGPAAADYQDAWSRLAHAQDAAGAVAELGPGRQGRTVPRTFATCYHSTLMAAFAATLTAARGREDPGGGPA
ncbi:MAG TPA: hypothetical protein VGL02_17130 [Streptomyces sp.]